MIHLDTNLLIELTIKGSIGSQRVTEWIRAGRCVAASAIAWSEFCNGPLTLAQKRAASDVIRDRILDFTWREAEHAALLFNITGRRRGSHSDCMIAAAAIAVRSPLATLNTKDFIIMQNHGLVLATVE